MDTALTLPNQPYNQLVDLWLYGRGPHTQRAYCADVGRYLALAAALTVEALLAERTSTRPWWQVWKRPTPAT